MQYLSHGSVDMDLGVGVMGLKILKLFNSLTAEEFAWCYLRGRWNIGERLQKTFGQFLSKQSELVAIVESSFSEDAHRPKISSRGDQNSASGVKLDGRSRPD